MFMRTSGNSDSGEYLTTWRIFGHIMHLVLLSQKSLCKQDVFTKFASYSVVILTHKKPNSYWALIRLLYGSTSNTNAISKIPSDWPTLTGILARAE